MKALQILVISGLFTIAQAGFITGQDEGGWNPKKQQDGISVYSREVAGSKFKEIKVTVNIQTSLSSIIALFKDVPAYTSWVYLCDKSETVMQGRETEDYYYSETAAPWPISNRDVVVYSRVRQDPDTKVVTSESENVTGLVPEKKGIVRIPMLKSVWTLIPKENSTVDVSYELSVDPGGWIPAWLVNLTMATGPYNTILSMREELKKEKYQSTKFTFIKEL